MLLVMVNTFQLLVLKVSAEMTVSTGKTDDEYYQEIPMSRVRGTASYSWWLFRFAFDAKYSSEERLYLLNLFGFDRI